MFGMPRDISEEHDFELDPVYVSKSFEWNHKRHSRSLIWISKFHDVVIVDMFK